MQRSCQECSAPFTVEPEDEEFYGRLALNAAGKTFPIPPPTRCPRCRQQRRLAFRNERTLHWRRCPGTGQQFLSMYSPEVPYTVYSPPFWKSDQWDPLCYGQRFDFSRTFFEQFAELQLNVPLLGLNIQADNENCEYTNGVTRNRNCYYVFAANSNEDCYYSTYIHRSRDVADSLFLFDSERCYDCVDCYNCYDLISSEFCSGCSSSKFLVDCRGCSDCFACVGLANKQFHLFNKALPKAEYFNRVDALRRSARGERLIADTLDRLKVQMPRKFYAGLNNENVLGDHLSYSRNAFYCFDCTYLEDCKYCTWFHKSKSCYDCYGWGVPGELGYELHLCGNGFYNIQFCDSCSSNVSELRYCRLCQSNCSDLFGCIGLRQQRHCVLNVAYSKHEYEKLVARIADHMRETGEWGEFFPAGLSPFSYNETLAQEYFPLDRTEALRRGLRWNDHLVRTRGKETITRDKIPDDIALVADDIVGEIFACGLCQANFRITTAELALYRTLKVSLPSCCFDCRYKSRMDRRNGRVLYERGCGSCGEPMLTTYGPDRQERILCERCYERAGS